MTTTGQPRVSHSLEQFLALPETEPASQYVCGEVILKPMPETAYSRLQLYLGMLLFQFLQKSRLGWVGSELAVRVRAVGRASGVGAGPHGRLV